MTLYYRPLQPNLACTHDYLRDHGASLHALEACKSALAASCWNMLDFIEEDPGTVELPELDAILVDAQQTLNRYIRLSSSLNGDGTAHEECEEWSCIVERLRAEFLRRRRIDKLGQENRQLIDALAVGSRQATLTAPLHRTKLEELELDPHLAPEDLHHVQRIRDEFVCVDIDRETQRLSEERKAFAQHTLSDGIDAGTLASP